MALAGRPGQGQAPYNQSSLHARVVALYGFHPARVSDAERKAKSAEMDAFWKEMTAQPEVSLPLLRAELRNPDNPTFFYADGTQLLLTLSHAKEDEELCAQVLPRVDLLDTQPTEYFRIVHQLAAEDVDVSAAALHSLDDAHFQVSVPQHAMTLDRQEALMYMLLAMRPELWTKPAVSRLAMEKDTQARIALVFALFYAQTDEADAALRSISHDAAQAETVRAQAAGFLAEEQKARKSLSLVHGSVAELQEQRRERLRAVSDEAMDDVQAMTVQIVELRAKGRG